MGLSFIALIASLSVLYVRLSQPARSLMAVSAQSEVITVEDVQNADLRMPFDGAIRRAAAEALDGAPESSCLHGLFTPAQHAALSLRRLEHGPLVVEVRPNQDGFAGDWTDQQGSDTLRGALVFLMDPGNTTCPPKPLARMPVGGRVVLGEDFGPSARLDSPRPILRSGEIDIFGRASPPFGITLGIKVQDSLYPGGSLRLPAGSRLRECDGDTAWWGFVETHFGSNDVSDRAMTVALTTSASRLALTTPGGAKTRGGHSPLCGAAPGGGAGEADDVVAVSSFAKLFADPYVSILWALMLAAFAVFQMVFAALSIPPPATDP